MSKNKTKKNKLIECPKCKGYGGDFDCFDGHTPVLINPCHMCLGLGSIKKDDFSSIKKTKGAKS